MRTAMHDEAEARGWETDYMRVREWMLVPDRQKRAAPAASTVKYHVSKVAKMHWRDKAEWILLIANRWPLLVKLVLEQVHDKQIAACRDKKKTNRKRCNPDKNQARSGNSPKDAEMDCS